MMTPNNKTNTKRPIESDEQRDKKRVNNPPVGLVNEILAPKHKPTRLVMLAVKCLIIKLSEEL